MKTSSLKSKLNGSKMDDFDNQNTQNLIKLTTQVERLTQVLNMKIEQVDMLNKQFELQKSITKPKEIEELISTVEEQTKEIEKWAEKYQKLQQQNLQLQQKNDELEQVVNLLQNNATQQYINYNDNLPSLKEIQSKQNQQSNIRKVENQNHNEQLNNINTQNLQKKQEEINQLKFQLSQIQQELLNEKQLHRELIIAEEARVRDQERKSFNQYKQDTQSQLLLQKKQIDTLQKQLDNSYNFDEKSINRSQIKELNEQFPQNIKIVGLLDNDVQNLQTANRQSYIPKLQKEQTISNQQYQLDKFPNFQPQTQRIGPLQNTSFSLEGVSPTELQFQPNNINQIQEQINQTMAQIEKSIIQVDLMKQTNYLQKKIVQEQIQPSNSNSLLNSQFQQQQLNIKQLEPQKAFSQVGQQSNNFYQFNQKQYF
ncbi:unnamed protein product [Paramecium sonneborni]|uniref:Uncharacterized protein n=1 Tax=Paramecium sonneborni TaxID=65129 RepID=A0A8S1Q9J6_9CILI|nr:unnamed protein product [Paramecium sonneborni]